MAKKTKKTKKDECAGKCPCQKVVAPSTCKAFVNVWKIGTNEQPAGPEDIENFQIQLAARRLDPTLSLVTHHGVEFEQVCVVPMNYLLQLYDRNIITNGEFRKLALLD